jgi:hypothetical protein
MGGILSFGRSLFLAGDGLARAFTRSGVRAGPLTAHRKPSTMANAPVASDVHEPLDVHADVRAKVTLDGEFGVDDFPDPVEFVLGKVLYFFIDVDIGLFEDPERRRLSDAENIRERHFASLVIWYVNSCNTGHCYASLPETGKKSYSGELSLPLFVLGVFRAYHPHDTPAFDHLATDA